MMLHCFSVLGTKIRPSTLSNTRPIFKPDILAETSFISIKSGIHQFYLNSRAIYIQWDSKTVKYEEDISATYVNLMVL